MPYTYPHYPNPRQPMPDARTLTFDQVREVIELVRDGKRPNGEYGDDQCSLWEMVTRELGIEIR